MGKDKLDARRQSALEEYLFIRGPAGRPPRGLDRGKLVDYLDDRLGRPVPVACFWRIRDLCDEYDLVEALPVLEKHTEERPRDSDKYNQALAFTITIAELGDAPRRSKAHDHYEKVLVTHHEAPEHYEHLAECYVALAPDSTSDSLKRSVERRKKQIEPQIEEDYSQRIEHLELEAFLNNEVPAAEDAHGIIKRLLAMTNPAARVREYVKIYLGIEYGGGPYLDPWAVRMIRRHAKDVDQQGVIDACRQALESVDRQKLPKDEKEFVRRRALRAIDFFGGELDPKERKFLGRFEDREEADDPLSNESPSR